MAMSKKISPEIQDDEIEMLLPFYVTGRLDPDDAEKIDERISRCPDIENILSLIREEREGAVAANKAVAARPVVDFERLAAAIAITPARTASPAQSLLDWIRRWFEIPASQPRAWLGAAAAFLIVAQGAAISLLVATQHPPTLTIASGGREAPGSATTAVVRFADDATTLAVAGTLAELGMAIVDGPRSGNLFSVRLGAKEMTEAERSHAIDKLRARSDVVIFVTRQP
jgi:anti-sigma factor RsiW